MTEQYRTRKAYFDGLLTLFGRNPVLEALSSPDVTPVRLHLAESNRPTPEIETMRRLAADRNVEIQTHTREALARISKNGRQDQGVAIDIEAPLYRPIMELLDCPDSETIELIAVDQVTNPQNLGMIIRSVAASPLHGMIIAQKGNARIDGLVIKASAGTLFKARIYHCSELYPSLFPLMERGYSIYGLDSKGLIGIQHIPRPGRRIFILGNESTGLSPKVRDICSEVVSIPLANGVESLNVGMAATLVAFRTVFMK